MGESTFHEDARWGDESVDPNEPSLPGLKARFLVDHVPASGSVLDVGCGEGKLLRTLARHTPKLTLHGCDIRVPQRAPDVFTFAQVKGDELPYPEQTFDAAMLFDVLEHVPDPGALLAQTARVLRPGGKLVAFVPVEGEALSFYRLFRKLLGDDVYVETTLAGYLGYASVHHALHHWRATSAWMQRRQRWHAQHHRAGAVPGCFGVTSSFDMTW